MSRRRLWGLLCIPLALLLIAWDTRVIKTDTWRSAYFGGQSNSLPEHSTLSDMVLDSLGVGHLFGIRGEARATLVDINATWFRVDRMEGLPREGDDRRTAVEERLLPPPAQFSGLPDYSYGPADWFNKNTTCPVGGGPADEAICHEFAGWMGVLNSVHFGSQARRMYAHYHRLALQRAGRARDLRRSMSPAERVHYAAVLRESELQALMYEGYAQHFLQDRWAIGHMWERWNGPDIPSARYREMEPGLAVGAIAGLIHGAESVLNDHPITQALMSAADPMSSPLPGEDAARPMVFRHESLPGSRPVPAIGDERLADMRLGRFGASYGGQKVDVSLDVSTQRSAMLECSGAGWAEVIRALGPGDNGGFGAYAAPLANDAPDFDVLGRETCWDMWATNRSMYVGFVGEGVGGIAALAGVRITTREILKAEYRTGKNTLSTGDLVDIAWRMWRRQWLDPDGTDIARGGIGPLWGTPTGQDKELPIYAEPINPDELPRVSPGGVDRQTLFGAMSGAHSDYWCGEDGLELMALLRRSDRPDRQQLCQYVADMAWQGIDPGYEGRMSRQRMVDGKPMRSLCQIRRGRRESSADDPRDPYFLDQGYVDRGKPRGRDPAFGERPAANWCARVPVVRLSRDKALRDANIVQELSADAARVELIGQDFGERKGQVFLFEEGRSPRPRGTPRDWSDNRIELHFSKGELKPGRDYLVEIRTDDGRRSVGLFILRVRPDDAPEPPVAQAAGVCDTPFPAVPTFDAGAAAAQRLGPNAMRASPRLVSQALKLVRRDFAIAQGPIRTRLIQERGCILRRMPAGAQALEALRVGARAEAARQSAAYFEAEPRSNVWSQACAVADRGRPVMFRYAYLPMNFREPSEFWTAFGREIDGVLQYNRFAETMIGAWSLALENPDRPLAPDPALIRAGYDMSISDPAEVVRRYFRPVSLRTDTIGRGMDLQLLNLRVFREVKVWSDSADALTAVTFEGIAKRRAYEAWLVSELRARAGGPIEAHCIAEASTVAGFAPALYLPDGARQYRGRDGRPYARIGWPDLASVAGGGGKTAVVGSDASMPPPPPPLPGPGLPGPMIAPPVIAPPSRPRRISRGACRRRRRR